MSQAIGYDAAGCTNPRSACPSRADTRPHSRSCVGPISSRIGMPALQPGHHPRQGTTAIHPGQRHRRGLLVGSARRRAPARLVPRSGCGAALSTGGPAPPRLSAGLWTFSRYRPLGASTRKFRSRSPWTAVSSPSRPQEAPRSPAAWTDRAPAQTPPVGRCRRGHRTILAVHAASAAIMAPDTAGSRRLTQGVQLGREGRARFLGPRTASGHRASELGQGGDGSRRSGFLAPTCPQVVADHLPRIPLVSHSPWLS